MSILVINKAVVKLKVMKVLEKMMLRVRRKLREIQSKSMKKEKKILSMIKNNRLLDKIFREVGQKRGFF